MSILNRDIITRVLLTLMDGILAFLIYTEINGILIGDKNIYIETIIFISLISAIFNNIEVRFNLKLSKRVNIITGILFSGVLSFFNSQNIYQNVVVFILLIFIWARGIRNSRIYINDMFNMKEFSKFIFLIFILNLFSYFMPHIYFVLISKYSIIYIFLGILLLLEIKNLKYSSNSKNLFAFEVLFTVIIVLIILLFSSETFRYFVFIYIYENIGKIFIFITSYIAFGLFLILSKLFSLLPMDSEYLKKAFEEALKQNENNQNKFEHIPQQYSGLTHLINFIAASIAISLIILIVIYMIKSLIKLQKDKVEKDFVEEKEISFGISHLGAYEKFKKSGYNIINNIREYIKTYTDPREQIRYQYKRFLKYLYLKKILTISNYSSRDVYSKLVEFTNIDPFLIEEITQIYEKVRYGKYMPESYEVDKFKNYIEKVKNEKFLNSGKN